MARITPYNRPPVKRLWTIVDAYYNSPDNAPYTISGACLACGLDFPTLLEWESNGTTSQKELVWFVKYSSLVWMEKGDKFGGVNSSLFTPLINRYFANEQDVVTDDQLELRVVNLSGELNGS